MQACFLSIPAMFESIHLYFSILTTRPQGLGAPPTKSVLPSLLAPHRVGWQERRHRQRGMVWACQRVLPPCWVTGIRALLWSIYIPFREDIEEEGRQRPTGATAAHGGKVALAIWTHRTGSSHHHRENKQVLPVLVLPLWPTSKHAKCVCVCVCACLCVCAAQVPVQMKNLDSPTLSSTLFKDMDTCRAPATARKKRKKETGR